MNFLMVGFISVYGIFILNMSVRSAFLRFVCLFISMYTNAAWYQGEHEVILFRNRVHFV